MPAMRRTVTAVLVAVLVGIACTAPRPTPVGATSGVQSPGATTAGGGPTGTPLAPSIGTPTSPPPSTPPGSSPTPVPSAGATIEPTAAPGAFDPGGVRIILEPFVLGGLSQPVYVTNADDGSHLLYVVERSGVIRVLHANGTLRAEPLLDLRERVGSDGELGMYAVAFHPDYESNGRFFVHWAGPENDALVEEYVSERGGGTVSPDEGRVLLRIDHPGPNDKGGWLGFGPDGYLYIAVGDGGGAAPGDPFRNARDTSKLLGKILRIDVDGGDPYGIPPDNPFAASTGGERPEIWASGLRNPWRASFDRRTGDLWIGDVGQDREEEIDVIPRGQGGLDFGWSAMEGTLCHRQRACDPADYVGPVSAYANGPRGYCAVTGGYVYRGSAFPFLDGGYLYSDFCNSNIHGLDAVEALASGGTAGRGPRLATTGYTLVSFGEDEEGELFAVDLEGGIFQLIPVELG